MYVRVYVCLGGLAITSVLCACDAKQAQPATPSEGEASEGRREQSVRAVPGQMFLGDQQWFSEIPFELSLVNGRKELVSIVKCVVPCGCLSFDEELAGTTIEPGASAIFTGTLNTGDWIGYADKELVVVLADDTEVRASVSINVVPSYTIQPHRLRIVYPEHGSANGRLQFQSVSDVKLLRATSDTEWLKAVADGDEIVVTVGPGLPHGVSSGVVYVHTTDAHRSVWPVPVAVVRAGGIDFRPNHLFLSPHAREGHVLVRTNLSVMSVESSTEALSLAFRDNTITVTKTGEFLNAVVRVQLSDGSCGTFPVTFVEGAERDDN